MRDQRLDLGRYVRNPFNKRGDIGKQLDFHDLFKEKARSGQYPWNPDRFGTADLLKRQQTRKLKLNPDLNFVGNTPFFDENQEVTPDYELFEGIGRFNRPMDYDFASGRPLTPGRPENQPDFNPYWLEAYRISPTLSLQTPSPRIQCRGIPIRIRTVTSWRWLRVRLNPWPLLTTPWQNWKVSKILHLRRSRKKRRLVKS